jgi:Domain of unknown function (DUF5666)
MRTHFPSISKIIWGVCLATITAISIGGVGQGGTGGRASSYGRILNFGSIWVNGVEFFTTTAAITIDNVPGQLEAALKAGMVVKVNGDLAADGLSGVATSVVHNTDLRGAVDAAPTAIADGFAFSVHGLAVRSDSRTIIAGAAGVGLLGSGQRISVSGLRDGSNGTLRASRIDLLAPGATGSVLRGTASAVSGTSFTLGATMVNAAGATLHDVTLAEITAGAEIRVRGTANVAGNALVANVVERAESLVGNLFTGFEAEIEGLVTGASTGQFMLNGVSVSVTAATVFENGTAADLVNGANVEAKGIATGASSLNAVTIKFPHPEAIEVQATVSAKSGNTITLISADNGVAFTIDAATEFRDSSNAKLRKFSLANLAVGDRVIARGDILKAGTLATRIERTRPATGFAIKTRVFEANGNALVLDDTLVATNAATVYENESGQVISAADFFSRAIGLRVHVRGATNGDVLMATSAEIKP